MNKINKTEKKDKYFYLGVLLIILVSLNLYLHLSYWFNWVEVLWFCDIGAIIAGIGLIKKNKKIISGILVLALPGQFLWILDFILEIIFNSGFGRTSWIMSVPLEIFIMSTILHAVLIPITFYATYKLGFSKKSFLFSIVFILILMPVSFLISDIHTNLNCINYPCDIHIDTLIESDFEWFGTLKYVIYEIVIDIVYISISYLSFLIIFNKIKIFKNRKVN
ncbi:MAG: hypothetical protein HRU03_08300 [Nanoarchaeales archaeon]|nr:hypothetical protein [Nanoarchaeales archaeon]